MAGTIGTAGGHDYKPRLALTSFTRTAKAGNQLTQIVTMLHGRGSTLQK